MFSQTAHYYDLIYGEFKDFEEEATRVAILLRQVAPSVRTVLDLGCGTGRHAAALREAHGFDVHGLDIEPAFVEISRKRCPGADFTAGDMADFDLGRTFDAVICLFSSIGYVKTQERLAATARCIASHLEEGGVALVEPWFTPGAFTPGRVHLTTAESGDIRISRMSWSRVQDAVSILEFHYLVGTRDGIQHLSEEHHLALFTRKEMEEGLKAGGLELIRYEEPGLTDRGLYILQRSRVSREEGSA